MRSLLSFGARALLLATVFVASVGAGGRVGTVPFGTDFDIGGDATVNVGAFTGDVTKSSGSLATTVAKINGVALGTTTATSGNILVGNGTQWETRAVSGACTMSSTAVLSCSALTNGTLSGTTTLTQNASALPSPITGTIAHLGGADGQTDIRVLIEGFDGVPSLIGRRAANTAVSPSAVGAGQVILALQGQGYGATGYSSSSRAGINMFAAEGWTDTAQGTYVNIFTTQSGTVTPVERVRVSDVGMLSVTVASGFAATLTNTTGPGSHVLRLISAGTTSGSVAFQVDNNGGSTTIFKITTDGIVTTRSATLATTSLALTNGAAAATGTLTNAPAAGNPTKWAPVNDNGTTRYVPMW